MTTRRILPVLLVCGSLWPLLLFLGCGRPAAPTRGEDERAGLCWFEDVTEKVGLHFVHEAGPVDGKYFMPQITGSGAALFDFDNDGRLDILLLQNGGPKSGATNRLFRQGSDGRFTDVSAGSGLDIAGYCMGVAVGDVNNDGWPDVLVTCYGGVKLFLNNGDGRTFTDVTREAGLENLHWGTSAAFVDYDRDGWLDLVVVNYVEYTPSARCVNNGGRQDYCHPSGFNGTVTNLYRNQGRVGDGKKVRFQDVTLASGLGRVPGPGLGVACADFNGDGWPDIFVANDGVANRLWINQRDGTFREDALLYGVAYNTTGHSQANMGVALGDVRGKGLFDLFVTHLTEETPALWVQKPSGIFKDQTGAAGLLGAHWRGTGFGTALADFDHDGALDLAIVNGRVYRGQPAGNPSLSPHWDLYAERNQLFRNEGKGHFEDISPANPPFCGTPGVSRGLALGDIDGDGAMDLLVTTVGGPARLYRNIAPKGGHWLLIRAVDAALKRDAYGARVTVEAGRRRWVGWVNPGQSYLCSNDPRVHFGLGLVEHVDRIRVQWPDGVEETFGGRKTDLKLTLKKGQGTSSAKKI
ncbi:MAG TPA: CRTAC1 family protein [Gemmataceae bacterium]|nr:CRTAC1 family protein [Gemmataceae bacterium]